MKFTLGYLPGSESLVPGRPQMYQWLTASYKAKVYEFDRWETDDSGVKLPFLKIYDSRDYPEEMVQAHMQNHQIVAVDIVQPPKDWNCAYGYLGNSEFDQKFLAALYRSLERKSGLTRATA